MATAKRIVPAPKPETITLSLSLQEAAALKQVCNSIGGSPKDSARIYFDSINDALTTLINCSNSPMMDSQSTIFFLDQERVTL